MALQVKGLPPQKIAILIIMMMIFTSLTVYLVYNNFRRPNLTAPPPAVAPGATAPAQTNIVSAPTAVAGPALPPSGFSVLPEIPVFNFSQSFVNDQRFLNLTSHGKLPVEPGALGRANPFTPFPGLPTTTSLFKE